MHDKDMTILRSFQGCFFGVYVGLCWKPPHHRVTVRVLEPLCSIECFRRSFICSSKSLDELIELLESARRLIGYLDDGGVLGRWNQDTPGMG